MAKRQAEQSYYIVRMEDSKWHWCYSAEELEQNGQNSRFQTKKGLKSFDFRPFWWR